MSGENKKEFVPVEKVVIVGSSNVGKTSLRENIVNPDTYRYSDSYRPTVGCDFYTCNFDDLSPIQLQVWDTAGAARYRAITQCYYKSANQILLTFDVSNMTSLKDLETIWLPHIKKIVADSTNPPRLILVGTKTDLEKTENTVSQDDIGVFANAHGMPCYLVSSKNNRGIDLVVDDLKRYALKRNEEKSQLARCNAMRVSEKIQPSNSTRSSKRSPSFSNKSLLAMTAAVAGAIAIGYALSQYHAEIALLVGAHVSPVLLVGLVILAAVVAAYAAYRCCSMFGKRPSQKNSCSLDDFDSKNVDVLFEKASI